MYALVSGRNEFSSLSQGELVTAFSYTTWVTKEITVFYDIIWNGKPKQEAQGLGALLDKMEENDPIKLDNTEI